MLRETTSRGRGGSACPSRTSERGGEGDCVKEGGGGEGERERERALGTREEPGTLTQGGALFSLVPLVWESNPKLQAQQESRTYTVPGTAARTVSVIGFGMYNPNCCQPCTTCTHFKKKDTSTWKACLGDSLADTQDFCVDRCGAMYWENETASECRRCSTCDSGFLAVT